MVHKQELHELIVTRALSKTSGLFEFMDPFYQLNIQVY